MNTHFIRLHIIYKDGWLQALRSVSSVSNVQYCMSTRLWLRALNMYRWFQALRSDSSISNRQYSMSRRLCLRVLNMHIWLQTLRSVTCALAENHSMNTRLCVRFYTFVCGSKWQHGLSLCGVGMQRIALHERTMRFAYFVHV